MRVRIGARSDIGRARERNEDAYLVQEPLFAVADGMGGHRGGAVASSLALETLRAVLDGEDSADALLDEFRNANLRVLERGESDRDLRGMGTTLTAVLTIGDRAHIAHIGDSRAYLLRNGSLKQLTEDHTLVQRMVREGRLTSEEAERHPQRSIITRALGVEEDVEPDHLTLDPILPGDRLLLCTDGLTSMVAQGRIDEVLQTEGDPQRVADQLVEEANQAGGEDNITVIVIDFDEGDADRPTNQQAATPVVQGAPVSPRASTSAVSAPAVASVTAQAREQFDTGLVTLPDRGAGPHTVSSESHADVVPLRPRSRAKATVIHRPRRWRSVTIWVSVIVLAAVVAVIAIRAYIDHQWYVGDSGGHVAIYNGIPTSVLGFELSHVEEATNLSAPRAEQLRPWRSLSEGITADSREAARRIVEQIREDLRTSTTGRGR